MKVLSKRKAFKMLKCTKRWIFVLLRNFELSRPRRKFHPLDWNCIELKGQPRKDVPNYVRDVQLPCCVHFHPSSSFVVWFWTSYGYRSWSRWWRFSYRPNLWRLLSSSRRPAWILLSVTCNNSTQFLTIKLIFWVVFVSHKLFYSVSLAPLCQLHSCRTLWAKSSKTL